MFTLIFIVLIIIAIILIKKKHVEGGIWMAIMATFFFGLIALFLGGSLTEIHRTIPKQIEMYEEENARIEEQLNFVVSQYMEYESGVVNKIADKESPVTLISLYPDLKSDKLVQSQIDVYIANNDKIKELKTALTKESEYKFWLYFGK